MVVIRVFFCPFIATMVVVLGTLVGVIIYTNNERRFLWQLNVLAFRG